MTASCNDLVDTATEAKFADTVSGRTTANAALTEMFLLASRSGNLDVLKFLLLDSYNKGTPIDITSRNQNAFSEAAYHGHLAVCQFLIEDAWKWSHQLSKLEVSYNQFSALRWAAVREHFSIVSYGLLYSKHTLAGILGIREFVDTPAIQKLCTELRNVYVEFEHLQIPHADRFALFSDLAIRHSLISRLFRTAEQVYEVQFQPTMNLVSNRF